ncbi:hypothetical protein P4O66_012048, partial [Electrophorus voltai]
FLFLFHSPRSVEPFQPDAPGWKRETVGRLCRSGSLGADPDILKAATSVILTESHANSSLSMSNTWPNKRDTIPRHRDPSSWGDKTGEVGSNRCSPLPARTLWASTISSPSHHPPTSPVIRQSAQDTLQQELPGRNSHQDEEPVDREEMMNSLRCLRNHAAKKRAKMMNSLRCLRNHAAKKRAKVSASGSDPEPDSPDSAVKLEPSTDSPSHTSPSLTSPLSESSLSSLYSPQLPPSPMAPRSDELTPGTPRKNPHERLALRPFSKPDLAFTQSFRLLSSDDWEKKIDGLILMRSLARYHSDVLSSRLHDVCLVLNQEVQNLRSGVSRVALVTLESCTLVCRKVWTRRWKLLPRSSCHKAGESNAFIRQDVDTALDCMVQNCTPTRSMNALLAGGLSLQIGARLFPRNQVLWSPHATVSCRLITTLIRWWKSTSLQRPGHHQGHCPHSEIQVLVKPTSELTSSNIVFTVPGEKPQDTPSARGRRYIPCDGMRYASSLNRQPQIVSSKDASKAQVHSIADKTKYIKQLKYTDRTRSRCVQAWPQVRILPTVCGGPNHMTRGR